MHEEEMRGCHNYPWREDGGNKERLLIVCKSVGMSSIMSAAGAEHPNPCDTTNSPQPTPPLTTSPADYDTDSSSLADEGTPMVIVAFIQYLTS